VANTAERQLVLMELKELLLKKDHFNILITNLRHGKIFSAFFQGFVNQAGIIVFILMIGGAFWIVNSSKAIDIGIFSFLKIYKKTREK